MKNRFYNSNNRALVGENGDVRQVTNYYPFGGVFSTNEAVYAKSPDAQPCKYNGKELDRTHGLDWYDYGARNYDATLCQFTTIDPLCEKYYHISPYAYCANNPIKFIDPDGMDWFYYKEKNQKEASWHWQDGSEYHTGVNDSKGKEVVLKGQKAVVEFDGYYNEHLAKGDKMTLDDKSLLADVTVYGPRGKDDIAHYKGYTMSSAPSRYGVVRDGFYYVYKTEKSKSGKLKSHWALENRGFVPDWTGFNPNHHKNVNPAYMVGIFIHSANSDGFAGKFINKDGNWDAVSKGCLLIHPDHWRKFNAQLWPLKVNSRILLSLKRI